MSSPPEAAQEPRTVQARVASPRRPLATRGPRPGGFARIDGGRSRRAVAVDAVRRVAGAVDAHPRVAVAVDAEPRVAGAVDAVAAPSGHGYDAGSAAEFPSRGIPPQPSDVGVGAATSEDADTWTRQGVGASVGVRGLDGVRVDVGGRRDEAVVLLARGPHGGAGTVGQRIVAAIHAVLGVVGDDPTNARAVRAGEEAGDAVVGNASNGGAGAVLVDIERRAGRVGGEVRVRGPGTI